METYDIIEMQDAYLGFHPAIFSLLSLRTDTMIGIY
jgi:hypothetical protein